MQSMKMQQNKHTTMQSVQYVQSMMRKCIMAKLGGKQKT